MKLAWILTLSMLAGCGQVGGVPVPVNQPTPYENSELEKVLWDVDEQWLCSGPYTKSYKDCVEFRSQYWVDQFFEVVSTGDLLNKEEMVATQSARIPANPDPRTAPYPDGFKLRAVYGDFAMATDHTYFKSLDKNGNYTFTTGSKVLRLFVKDRGAWRPAAAGLVPIILSSAPASPAEHSKNVRSSPDPQLEKQLAELDRAWMDSSDMKRRVAYVSKIVHGSMVRNPGLGSHRKHEQDDGDPGPFQVRGKTTPLRASSRTSFSSSRFTATWRFPPTAELGLGKTTKTRWSKRLTVPSWFL